MEFYTYLRNMQDLLSDEKTPNERRVGVPLKNQSYRLVHWMSVTLSLRKTSQESIHQFGKKVLPGLFLGYALCAGGIWKGDIMVADIEELEQMDASEIYATRLNAKEVLTHVSGEKFISPIADETVKISGGDQRLRTSTLIRDRTNRGEEQAHINNHLFVIAQDDSTLDDAEARNDFWSTSGDFSFPSSCGTQSQTLRAERSIIPYSTEIYRRYRKYHTSWDVMLEKNIDDYWNVDGDRELSDTWTGFTRVTVLSGHWRENKRPPCPTNYGQKCGNTCLRHQNGKRSKRGLSRNQSSIMPEDFVVLTSWILKTRNSSLPWKMLAESLKFRCQQQCLVKLHCAEVAGKPAALLENIRQNTIEDTHGRISEQESWRSHCKKRHDFTKSLQVHKFIPVPQAMEIPETKAAVDKMGKLEKMPAWSLTKVKNKWK